MFLKVLHIKSLHTIFIYTTLIFNNTYYVAEIPVFLASFESLFLLFLNSIIRHIIILLFVIL